MGMEQGIDIYRFCENKFIGETPEWDDGILVMKNMRSVYGTCKKNRKI